MPLNHTKNIIKSWKEFESFFKDNDKLISKGSFPNCFYSCINYYLLKIENNALIPKCVQQLRYRVSDYLDEQYIEHGQPINFQECLESALEVQPDLSIRGWDDFVLAICENLAPGPLEIEATLQLFYIWTKDRVILEIHDSNYQLGTPLIYGDISVSADTTELKESENDTRQRWRLAKHKNQYRVIVDPLQDFKFQPTTISKTNENITPNCSPFKPTQNNTLQYSSLSPFSPLSKSISLDSGLSSTSISLSDLNSEDDWKDEVDNCYHMSFASYESNPITYLNRLDIKPRHSITDCIGGDTFLVDKRSTIRLVQPFILGSRLPVQNSIPGSFKSRKTFYLSFRGTSDFADQLNTQQNQQTTMHSLSNNVSIHQFYNNQIESFPLNQLFKWIQKGNNLVITGHSVGAGVAISLALKMLCDPYITRDLLRSRLICITFGAPFVADLKQSSLSTHEHQFHNILSRLDPLPNLLNSLLVLQTTSPSDTSTTGFDHHKQLCESASQLIRSTLQRIYYSSILPINIIKETSPLFTDSSIQYMKSLSTRFTLLGNYHFIESEDKSNGYQSLRSWITEDQQKLENGMVGALISSSLGDERIQESISNHLLVNYLARLPTTPLSTLSSLDSIVNTIDCKPKIDNVKIIVVPDNGVVVKIEGPYVSFIGAAGLPGKLKMVAVNIRHINSIEMVYKKVVDFSDIVPQNQQTQIPQPPPTYLSNNFSLVFSDISQLNNTNSSKIRVKYLSIFKEYVDDYFKVEIINYIISYPLSMVGSKSLKELLYSALWMFILCDSHDSRRIHRILDRLLSTVPSYYLLYQLVRSNDSTTKEICRKAIEKLSEPQLLKAFSNAQQQFGVTLTEFKELQLIDTNKEISIPSPNMIICTEPRLLSISKHQDQLRTLIGQRKSKQIQRNWNDILGEFEKQSKLLDLFLCFREQPTQFPDGLFERLLGSTPRNYSTIKKILVKIFKIDSLPSGLELPEDFMTELAIYKYFSQRGFALRAFDHELSDHQWTSSRPERILSLYHTMLIHELRLELAVPRIVVTGLKSIGKSTSIEKVFGIPRCHVDGAVGLQYGSRASDRTVVPGFYMVGGGVTSVIDFPGSDDIDPTIKSIADIALDIPGLCMIILRCTSLSSQDTFNIVKQFRESSPQRPLIICVNRVDEWYRDLDIDPDFYDSPDSPISDHLVKTISQEWKKISEPLRKKLHTTDYLLPTIIDRKLLSDEQLERLSRVFEFKEELDDPRFFSRKCPSFLHLPCHIREIIGDIFMELKWLNESDLQNWREYSNDLNTKIPLKTIFIPHS